MVVDIGGVGQGVSELSIQSCKVFFLRFYRSFEFKFRFPQFGRMGRGPYGGGPSWCQMRRQ